MAYVYQFNIKMSSYQYKKSPLQWRHNGCNGISNPTSLLIVNSTVYSKISAGPLCHGQFAFHTHRRYLGCIWKVYIDGLVQHCSNSSALSMELLQPCTKPSTWCLYISSQLLQCICHCFKIDHDMMTPYCKDTWTQIQYKDVILPV